MKYTPRGVCAREMEVEVRDGKVVSAVVRGGCPGNLQGVTSLVRGMDVDEAIARMKGIRCGMKPTSCPDQLARALELAKAEQ